MKKATKNATSFIKFLHEVMRRRKKLPSQMALDLGISHATVSRWLSGKDIPSPRSCLGVVGHIPGTELRSTAEWPEFREYARQKYPDELDEDLIVMIEDLIERRRAKRYSKKKKKLGE